MALLLPIGSFAQSSETITPKALDNKAEVIKIKQDNQDTLNASVTDLEKENNQLEKETMILKSEQTDILASIIKNESNLTALNKLENKTTNTGVIIINKEALIGVVNDSPLKNIN